MARGVNKVILVGNLGNDPEVKYTNNGTAVANASLAVNESWKDKSGEKQERTEWVRLIFWSKLAEIAGEYLKKGSQIYVEGKLQTRKWQDRDGQDRYTTEVAVSDLQMLGGKPTANSGQVSNSQPNSAGNRYEQGAIDAMQTDGGDPFSDEIPF